ncbi:MAG: NAD(P)H-binding protein [Planctomycetes bacterium]|nr:NAD(P)H-binding protein [Planctomycetota bacterium]
MPVDRIKRVLVTGAAGFVGRQVVRELVARGMTAVCLVRDRPRFETKTASLDARQLVLHTGDLFSAALPAAADGADACIHLVGIIMEHARRGQTFERVHEEGTRRVIEVLQASGVQRLVHMSALGSVADAPSRYHRTKHAAEQAVRASGLCYTIFQPSLIHGPDGEFIRDLFVPALRRVLPPFLPYFGDGRACLQPVLVDELARVVVAALAAPAAAGRTFALGGAEALSWRELWEVGRALVPGARRWKPKCGLPVWLARLLGGLGDALDRRLGWRAGIPFNLAQVQMSCADNVCAADEAEQVFGVRLRGFRETLAEYAPRLR